MYWREKERFRGQETQISRKQDPILLLGVQFVESRLVRTSDRDYVGSTTPWYVWMEQFTSCGGFYWAAEPQETGVHSSPWPGAILCSQFLPISQPQFSHPDNRANPISSVGLLSKWIKRSKEYFEMQILCSLVLMSPKRSPDISKSSRYPWSIPVLHTRKPSRGTEALVLLFYVVFWGSPWPCHGSGSQFLSHRVWSHPKPCFSGNTEQAPYMQSLHTWLLITP